MNWLTEIIRRLFSTEKLESVRMYATSSTPVTFTSTCDSCTNHEYLFLNFAKPDWERDYEVYWY